MKINYVAPPTAQQFHHSNAFVRGLMGPIGSGKSVACCMEIFRRAQEQKPAPDGYRKTRWLVVRNTLPQLETTTIKTWIDWFPPGAFGKMTGKPPYTHYLEYGDVKAEVVFIALDKPEDVKKLLSFECTGIWFNEARELDKAIIDAGTGRVGRYPSAKDGGCTWSGIIMDTNPPDDSHWWYHLSQEATPENWSFFKQPSGLDLDKGENLEHHMQPASEELTDEELSLVKRPDAKKSDLTLREKRILGQRYYTRMVGGKTKEWINVYVHGNFGFVMDGKPVFGSSWNDMLHVSPEPLKLNPHGALVCGIDCSGRNPAAVFLQKSNSGQYQLLDELVCEDIGAVAFSKLLSSYIKEKYPHNQIRYFGDPAGSFKSTTDERTYVDILRTEGIHVLPAQTNKIGTRLQAVESALLRLVLGKPALLVDKKCKILRRGMNGGYKFKRMNVGGDARYQPEPEKNRFSDVQDALQYAMLGAGEGGVMRGYRKSSPSSRQPVARMDFSL